MAGKKILRKGDIRRVKKEINIQKNLDHPNVACMYEAFVDTKYIYLITEHCTGGEL